MSSPVVNDVTSAATILKILFATGLPVDLIQRAGPWLSMVPNVPAGGRSYVWAIRDFLPQSRGNTFDVANNNSDTQNVVNFTLPNGTDAYPEMYGIYYISNKLLASARGAPNERAFADECSYIINGARMQQYLDRAIYFWGDGSGALGQIAAVTSTTITLTLYTDGVKFFKNGTYTTTADKFSTEPTNGVKLTGRNITVSSKTCVLTFSAVPSGATVGDYIFAQGYYATGYGEGVILGVEAYVVDIDSDVSTEFLGVTRSVDRNMLAGFPVDGSNKLIQTSITELVYAMSLQSQRGKYLFMNDIQMQQLQLQTANSIVRDTSDQSGMSILGFQKYKANFAGATSLDIYTDPFCRGDRIFCLDPAAFEFLYLAICDSNPQYWAPGLGLSGSVMSPDIPLITMPTADNVQFRLYTYGQLKCKAPGWCGVISNLPV